MNPDCLTKSPPHRVTRVERGVRILKHHLDGSSQTGPIVRARRLIVRCVDAVDRDRTGRRGLEANKATAESDVAESDLVLPRLHGLSPFQGTELDFILRNLGVRTLVGVGVSVNVAIPNLTFDAVNAAYQVVIPRDAVAGFPAEYVEAVFEHSLGAVATLVSSAELLKIWKTT